MKMSILFSTAILAMSISSSACTVQDDADFESIENAASERSELALVDYADCLDESSQSCEEEREDLDDSFNEFDDLVSMADDTQSLVGGAWASCPGGGIVACIGDVCIAVDNVGCACESEDGVLDVRTCSGKKPTIEV